MGKLVAFWSPYSGRARVTSSLCAVAGAMGLLYPEVTVAISHTKRGNFDLEEKLDNRAGPKKELYDKFGLTALSLNYMQSILTSEKIQRCAIPLSMESLFLYPGETAKGGGDDVVFRIISEHLVKEFSLVFLDLESGHSARADRFLSAADFIVIVLPQSPKLWECFISEETEWLENRKFSILFGSYLKESRYGINYLKQKKEEKILNALAGVIPMNVGYMDAMQEGRTIDYFYRNQLSRKKEENYEFMVQTKKAAEVIKKKLFLS